jgi:hypothetical protein
LDDLYRESRERRELEVEGSIHFRKLLVRSVSLQLVEQPMSDLGLQRPLNEWILPRLLELLDLVSP